MSRRPPRSPVHVRQQHVGSAACHRPGRQEGDGRRECGRGLGPGAPPPRFVGAAAAGGRARGEARPRRGLRGWRAARPGPARRVCPVPSLPQAGRARHLEGQRCPRGEAADGGGAGEGEVSEAEFWEKVVPFSELCLTLAEGLGLVGEVRLVVSDPKPLPLLSFSLLFYFPQVIFLHGLGDTGCVFRSIAYSVAIILSNIICIF